MDVVDLEFAPKNELIFSLIVRHNDVYVLPNAPQGWETASPSIKRDSKYFGTIRNFTAPVDFVLDGADILRQELETYGIQAIVQLKIEQLDSTTGNYVQVYLGDCDFSKYVDTENVFTINMMDSGIESKIAAFGDVTYEIPVDIPNAVNLKLTPIVLTESSDLVTVPTKTDFSQKHFFPAINIVNNQQQSVNPTVRNVRQSDDVQIPDFSYATDDRYFFEAQAPGVVQFTEIKISGIVEGDVGSYIAIFNQTGNEVKRLLTVPTRTGATPYPVNIDTQFNITVNQGDRLFLYCYAYTQPFNYGFILTSGSISATYSTQSPATIVHALRPFDLYNALLQKIWQSGEVSLLPDYPVRSYLLSQSNWQQLLITSGDAIRGFAGSVIKTSWNDFWSSINAECNCEFGDENGTAVLEAKANAFKASLPIIELKGEISNYKKVPATDYLINTITVGYQDQTYDQDNGRREFNSQQEYITPITRIQKEYNIVSKYRADSYGIEFTRINLSGKETKDADSDNDTFFVYVKAAANGAGQYEPEGAEAFQSVTGIDPGVYNIRLSPKEMLFRHGNYIASVMDKLDGARITFTSALKDVEMVAITTDGKRIAEGESISVSALGSKLFLPHVVTFKNKLPLNTLAALYAMPNGCIQFTYRENQYRGFIIQASVDVARNSEQEFTVLLTPDNDLSTLVH